MKSRFMRIILSVLILSLALQTIPLPALARSEANRHQTEIEVPTILSENRSSSLPDDGDDPPYPIEDDFDCTTVNDVSESECEALVDLYQSTNGAGWWSSSGWLQSTKVTDWYGVTVTDGSGVTQLNLAYNELDGSIPSSLGDLSNLQTLNLNYNQLDGNIPSTLGDLLNLQALNLFYNQLTGSIPVELSNLTNLKELNLAINELDGNIPSTLGNLANLQYLYLSSNKLTGGIPVKLGNLTNLRELNLADNQLTNNIPSTLGNLSELEILYLQNNRLVSSIPSTLGYLSNLQILNLSQNQLTGSIPLSFVKLTNLLHFNFSETSLCEPATEKFLDWKKTLESWYGTNLICEDKLICLPLIFR